MQDNYAIVCLEHCPEPLIGSKLNREDMNPKSWLVVPLLGFAVAVLWTGSRVQSQPPGSPKRFVAEIETRFLKSPSDIEPDILHQTYARKSDGSFAKIIDSRAPDGSQSGKLVEINDATSFRYTLLEPFTKSKMTLQYTAAEFHSRIAALESENCDADNQGPDSSNTEVLLGHRTRHHLEQIPLGNGSERLQQWVHERWTIPELKCFAVKTIDRRSDGATTLVDVTSLREGEPPSSYFAIPPDYVERSPTRLESEFQSTFRGATFWGKSGARAVERQYERHHPSR